MRWICSPSIKFSTTCFTSFATLIMRTTMLTSTTFWINLERYSFSLPFLCDFRIGMLLLLFFHCWACHYIGLKGLVFVLWSSVYGLVLFLEIVILRCRFGETFLFMNYTMSEEVKYVAALLIQYSQLPQRAGIISFLLSFPFILFTLPLMFSYFLFSVSLTKCSVDVFTRFLFACN